MSADDKPHIPKIDETRPVVWTPEDASRFLTSAIHEAQKPLAEALKQRPITSRALTLIVAVLIIAAIVIALILSSQLEKTEKRADAIQAAREEILSEKVTLEAQTTTLQERLSAVTDQHLELRNQIDALRQNEEKHKRTQSDLGRFRRQNELLRSQITGLELEKVALARQLEAVKALAETDPEGGESDFAGDGDPFDSSGAAVLDGSSPAPEEAGGAAAATEEPKENAGAPAPAPMEEVVVPEPAVPDEPRESADSPVPAPVPAESAAAPEPVVPEEPAESEDATATAPAEEVAVPDPAVPEEPEESVEPPAPAEDAIDVESLRERAAEAMEKAAASQTEADTPDKSVTPDSRDQFKLDPDKQAARTGEQETVGASFSSDTQETVDAAGESAAAEPADAGEAAEKTGDAEPTAVTAVVTAEMDKALREGRAVPGTLAGDAQDNAEAAVVAEDPAKEEVGPGDAEDAGGQESFPEVEEGVEAKPEAAGSAAENDAEEPAAESASASEYVTLDPDAKVPVVQADATESGADADKSE